MSQGFGRNRRKKTLKVNWPLSHDVLNTKLKWW